MVLRSPELHARNDDKDLQSKTAISQIQVLLKKAEIPTVFCQHLQLVQTYYKFIIFLICFLCNFSNFFINHIFPNFLCFLCVNSVVFQSVSQLAVKSYCTVNCRIFCAIYVCVIDESRMHDVPNEAEGWIVTFFIFLWLQQSVNNFYSFSHNR